MAPQRGAASEAARRITSQTQLLQEEAVRSKRRLSISSSGSDDGGSEAEVDAGSSASDFETVVRSPPRTRGGSGKAKASPMTPARKAKGKMKANAVTLDKAKGKARQTEKAATGSSSGISRRKTSNKGKKKQEADSEGESDSEFVADSESSESEEESVALEADEEEKPTRSNGRQSNASRRSFGGRGRGRRRKEETAEQTKEDQEVPGAGTLIPPRFIAEFTKASRACCKRCDTVIMRETLRVGVVVDHKDYGPTTHWYHAKCRPLAVPAEVLMTPHGVDGADQKKAGKKQKPPKKKQKGTEEADSRQTDPNPVKAWCKANVQGFSHLTLEQQDELLKSVKSLDEDVDFKPLDTEKLVEKEIREEREPPPELIMPLLPYQREALAWMCHQEHSGFRGGILADEMGMGKTIQAISLILAHLKNPPQVPREKDALKGKIISRATVVICPVVALLQWKSEIEKFTKPNSLKVHIYHGAKRDISPKVLADNDVVLTTYSIAEVDYRKIVEPTKVTCEYCSKRFLPDRYIVHRRYFCGPDAERTEKQKKTQKKKGTMGKGKGKGKGKTLEETEEEDSDEDLKKPTKGKGKGKTNKGGTAAASSAGMKKKQGPVKVAKKPTLGSKLPPAKGGGRKANGGAKGKAVKGKAAKGKGKAKAKQVDSEEDDEEEESDDDLLRKLFPKGKKEPNMNMSMLHKIHWRRIVLDEAHYIKERRCNTAKSIFAMSSDFKWCLTGTPLQNRVSELYSLIRFLQMDPYAYYMCRHCSCKSMDYRFGEGWKACEECGHSPIHHFSFFNRKIVNPIKFYGYMGEGRHAMMLLKEHVLDQVLLRRTKAGRADDIILPPKVVRVRRDYLDEREEDFYQAIYTQSRAQFDTYVNSNTVLNNYAHIFDLLMRLRQAVDHPYLVIYSNTKREDLSLENEALGLQNTVTPLIPEDEVDCGICGEEAEDAIQAECLHWFCRSCITDFITTMTEDASSLCPRCDQPLTVDLSPKDAEGKDSSPVSKTQKAQAAASVVHKYARHNFMSRLSNPEEFRSSTKIEALVQELTEMQQRDVAAKAIVFSQFVNMLDLIEFRLIKAGFKCVKLSGHMSVDQRDRALTSFKEDPQVKVFLISLKAGGVALNLTVANYIFLMDPWWNPAAEMQAIDRTHRLGQFKPIIATRFIVTDTVEERILRLQEKKQLIFEGTVGKSNAALNKLTEEDLRFLFS